MDASNIRKENVRMDYEKQMKIWDVLCELSGEQVANLLTDWHGMCLLDEGFYNFMIEEGFLDE